MEGERSYLFPVRRFAEGGEWIDGNKKWIQLYPYDSWDHPFYDTTTIDRDVASKLKDSFDNKVKNKRLFSDYEHGMDKAKGNKASGEFMQLDVRDDGLWGLVQFTDTARKEIDAGEWNYWSTAHHDVWKHPQTKEEFEFVFAGGGLTNNPYVKGMVPLNFSEVFVLNPDMEHAPEEHQDPIVGPDFDGPFHDDDAGDSGSRIETPPEAEDGTVPDRSGTVTKGKAEGGNMDEAKVREALGIGDDVDIVATIEALNTELTPLRELKAESEAAKQFSEQFPEEYERLKELEADSRDNAARRFSEQLATRRFSRVVGTNEEDGTPELESTTVGLSAVAIEEIASVVKKFSERTVSVDDFKGVLSTIIDGGIVDYGNKGSELAPAVDEGPVVASNNREARKMFSDKINEIVEKDELDFDAAMKLAIQKYPELYEQYLSPVTSS